MAAKFKRGDKIRVTVDGWRSGNHNAQAGDVYVVNDVSSEGVHTNLFYFTFDEIELVPVAEATGTAAGSAQDDKPKFKVGDRVRCVRDYDGAFTVGRNYTVAYYDANDGEDGRLGVTEADHGSPDGIGAYYFEPVAVAASNSNPEQRLTIQAGKFYKTRDGRKVGPMDGPEYSAYWEADAMWCDGASYAPDGRFFDAGESDDDLIAEWVGEPANDNGSTAGFTVPLCAYEDDFDICGHRDSDDDIVQLSVSELTAALADSLKVARKVGKTIKRGDLVVLARPALVTGIDRYHASVQTDGGNYSLPLAALTAA